MTHKGPEATQAQHGERQGRLHLDHCSGLTILLGTLPFGQGTDDDLSVEPDEAGPCLQCQDRPLGENTAGQPCKQRHQRYKSTDHVVDLSDDPSDADVVVGVSWERLDVVYVA